MNDAYYIGSPIILSKLFLFTMLVTNQRGIMLSLACLLLIIMCYSTSMYRILNKLEDNNDKTN